MQGWISLHRKIKKHWIYEENRTFSKFEAWVDILFEVNHKDNKFLLGSELVEVKRGSMITSLRKLSEKWNWSRTKTVNFLELLQNEKMIAYKSDTKKTLLTVENYDLYQNQELKKRHESDTRVTRERHEKDTRVTRKDTNNNVNNDLIMFNNDLIKEDTLSEGSDEMDIEKPKKKSYSEEVAIVINYLNDKTGSFYRTNTKKTISLISARLNEGFVLDDFKYVIDIKSNEWLNTAMQKYLRPETLFGTKFESYLNDKPSLSQQGLVSKTTEHNMKVMRNFLKKRGIEDVEI